MALIALSSNTSWGMYHFRKHLLDFLAGRGYSIELLLPRAEENDIDSEEPFHNNEIKLQSKGTNPLKDLMLIVQYYKAYRRIRPAIVINYTIKPSIYGTIAARLVGCHQIIAVMTGLGHAFIENGLDSRVGRLLCHFSFKYADRVWFLNSQDREEVIARRIVRMEKTRILPGEGIDVSEYSPQVPKHDIVVRSQFKFLFLARLLWEKGIREYIEASKEILGQFPSAYFGILGQLNENDSTYISKHSLDTMMIKDSIEYLGHSMNVKPHIAECDCVVLPSYREGMPRVLLEASSMAKPIIASNVPGCNDIVVDGVTGFLHEPRNVDSLVECMKKMLNIDEAARQKMGAAARARVIMNYSNEIVWKTYLEELGGFIAT